MPYDELFPAPVSEFGEVGGRSKAGSLDQLFCDQLKRARSCVGLPEWMHDLHLRRQVRHRDRWGAKFVADAVATNGHENFVFELKYGAKYEPMALAEVLHHAEAFEQSRPELAESDWSGKARIPTVPVIVSQWNGWTRSAISWLRRALAAERLRLLEGVALRGSNRQTLVWFDEPFGWSAKSTRSCPAWIPHALTADLEALRKSRDWRWHERSGATALLAPGPLASLDPSDERVMVSHLRDDVCLLWYGNDRIDRREREPAYLIFSPNNGRQPNLPWR